jgi:photosystem II stability/assembly factor-like uncharacterized protein
MRKVHTVQRARPLPAWASLVLTGILLALSLVFMAGLAYAQTGSISGTVTYYGDLEPGTFHLNVDYTTDPNQPPGGGINLYASGDYTLSGLADDTYYVCVNVDPGPATNPYTCYDPNADGEPDPIVVAGGEAVTGIDIRLGGPWRSLDGPAVEGGQVNVLAVHPEIANTLYAAVAPVDAYDSGPSTLYKTTDGAASWTPVYVAEHQVYALGVTGTRVYAGAFNPNDEGASIYASHDSGLTWTPVYTSNDRGVWLDIAFHPSDPDVAIIGGWHYHQAGGERVQSGLVYRTDNAGLTWTPILTVTYPEVEGQVNAVLIHPVTPTLLLASAKPDNSSDSAIYRSEDGGATWPVSFTISGAHVMSLLADASDPPMLYAGTGQGKWTGGPSKVFRSTDAGLTWEDVSSDAGGLLLFEPPGTIYAGPVPLWASTANGDPGTWTLVQDWAPGPQLSFAIDLGPSPAALYRGGGWSGVSKSTNGGVDWTGANNGIGTLVTPVDIAVDPQTLDKLFVAGECLGDGGWMSTDGGETWTVPSGFRSCIMSFAVNPQDPDIVYAGAMSPTSGGVLRSEDGGLTFRPIYTATYILPDGSGGQQAILDLAISPSMPDTVYAGGSDSPNWEDASAVVVRSLDDGVSWTEVFTLPPVSQVEVLAINPLNADVIYAGGHDCSGPGCEGFVYRTADGGDSWDLTLVTTDTVRSIVIDHWLPNVLYVADDGYWVRKSTDSGDSWTVVRPPWWVPPGDPSGSLLAIDPNLPSHIYLGGWGYIAETTDGGATWSEWDAPLNQSTPEMQPSALTVDHGTVTQTLYAGFTGVWAHSRLAPQPHRIYLPLVLRSYTL